MIIELLPITSSKTRENIGSNNVKSSNYYHICIFFDELSNFTGWAEHQ